MESKGGERLEGERVLKVVNESGAEKERKKESRDKTEE